MKKLGLALAFASLVFASTLNAATGTRGCRYRSGYRGGRHRIIIPLLNKCTTRTADGSTYEYLCIHPIGTTVAQPPSTKK